MGQKQLETALARYSFIVSTEPCEEARVISTGTEGTTLDLSAAAQEMRNQFEEEMKSRGWLKSGGYGKE